MGAVKDLYYDVETLFIDGLSMNEIADQLSCPVELVINILADFGVSAEDVAEKPQDEVYSPYYGA